MSCQRVLSMLSAYIDEEVQSRDAATIEQHLADCPSCAQEFATLRRMTGMLGTVTEIEPPRALLERIEVATIRRPSFLERLRAVLAGVPRYARWALPAAAAAGILIGFALSEFSPQRIAPPEGVSQRPPVATAPFEPGEMAPTPPVAPVEIVEQPVKARWHWRSPAPKPVTVAKAGPPVAQPAVPDREPSSEAAEAPSEAPPESSLGETSPAAEVAQPGETLVAQSPEVPAKEAAEKTEVAKSPSPLEAKLQQDAGAMERLRAQIAARNKQRKHETRVERIEGEKYSKELASIRF